MIVVNEATSTVKGNKTLICPKCTKGRIGSVPPWSKTDISRRGKPPPTKQGDCITVKCPLCGAYVPLTIE